MKTKHRPVTWKGIILTAGAGTRLYPSTLAVNKQLLNVYDKPMIYYPLSALIMAGIRDIMIITTEEDMPRFRSLLGDGAALGLRFTYAIQPRPEGIPQAFVIARKFIAEDNVCLILGDNIFHGQGLQEVLQRAVKLEEGGLIFGCRVKDPHRYGVVEFDESGKVLSIEEKPASPRSDFAVTGLYFFDNDACSIATKLKASERGELEIADVIRAYCMHGKLTAELLGDGCTWWDTGTHDSLLEASLSIQTIEKQEGRKVACIEEIAYRMGYIDAGRVRELAEPLRKSSYGQYLLRLAGGQEPKETKAVFSSQEIMNCF